MDREETQNNKMKLAGRKSTSQRGKKNKKETRNARRGRKSVSRNACVITL